MGAQTKQTQRRKCNHDDTENTLVLIGDERKIGKLTMLRKATLIEVCRVCQNEANYFVAGGVLFDAGYDNT
jgi:hypothetical protein